MKSNTEMTINDDNMEIISSLVLNGDLSHLKQDEKVKYYFALCKSLAIDPLQKPFDLIELSAGNGKKKLVLYPNKNCAEQFRLSREISIIEKTTETMGGVLIMTMKGKDKAGRIDIASASVSIDGLKGDYLANAYMKCETKCKRRLTFSMSPTGMADDLEFENQKPIELDFTDDIKNLTANGFLMPDDLRQLIKARMLKFKKSIGDKYSNYLPAGKTSYNQCSDEELMKIDKDVSCAEMILNSFSKLTESEIKTFIPEGKGNIHDCTPEERLKIRRELDKIFDAPAAVDDSDIQL